MDGHAALSMAISNIFAGSDRTVISLRSIIHNGLKNPECKKIFVAEIDEPKNQGKFV
jgi:hypothetical protein